MEYTESDGNNETECKAVQKVEVVLHFIFLFIAFKSLWGGKPHKCNFVILF